MTTFTVDRNHNGTVGFSCDGCNEMLIIKEKDHPDPESSVKELVLDFTTKHEHCGGGLMTMTASGEHSSPTGVTILHEERTNPVSSKLIAAALLGGLAGGNDLFTPPSFRWPRSSGPYPCHTCDERFSQPLKKCACGRRHCRECAAKCFKNIRSEK